MQLGVDRDMQANMILWFLFTVEYHKRHLAEYANLSLKDSFKLVLFSWQNQTKPNQTKANQSKPKQQQQQQQQPPLTYMDEEE